MIQFAVRISFILIMLTVQAQASDTVTLIHNAQFKSSKIFRYLPIDRDSLQLELSRCPEIFSHQTRKIGRQAMENLLICHALKESGKYKKIQYVLSGNTDRQKLDLVNNKADILGQTTFRNALNKSLFFSDDDFIVSQIVIKKEQINWSIYTTDNQVDSVREALVSDKLQELVGISMLSWRSNISLMQKLKLKSIKKITAPDNMFTILKRKRANFTLAGSHKNTIYRGGKLHRVEGFRVQAEYDRHFAINKNRPLLAQVIDDFIAKMRKNNDQITRAFKHAGILGRHSNKEKLN